MVVKKLNSKICIFLLGMAFYTILRGAFLVTDIRSHHMKYEAEEENDFLDTFRTVPPVASSHQPSTPRPQCLNALLNTARGLPTVNPQCSNTTCSALLFGDITKDKTMYESVEVCAKSQKRIFKDEAYYISETRNCELFKQSRGYFHEPLSQEEADFPIAFNLLVHRDIEQVERLLRAIYHPQNSYCVHLDGNAPPAMQEAVRGIAACFPNVFIPSTVEKIVYAGITRLQADINCMKDHLQSKIKWKYLLNLAGQSFPLKTNLELVRIFKIYNGANDIEGIHGYRVLRGRFQNEWIELDGKKMNKTGRKNPPPPHEIDIVRGSAYGVFSYKFVHYLINDEWCQDLLEWSRKTYSPDEHYWATLHHTYSNPHMNPPGGYSGNPNEKPWLAVYVKWGGVDKCYGQWKRGVCVFGVRDLPSLIDKQHLFCNKFYQDFMPLAYDCLEAYIRQKSLCPQSFNTQYYQSLPFIPRQKSSLSLWFH